MQVQLKQWGNSQGIRIPREILDISGFHINDTLTVTTVRDQIIISKPFIHKSLEERAAAFDGKLNLSPEEDWGEPVGSEVW